MAKRRSEARRLWLCGYGTQGEGGTLPVETIAIPGTVPIKYLLCVTVLSVVAAGDGNGFAGDEDDDYGYENRVQ